MRLQRIPVAMPEREGRGGEGREFIYCLFVNVLFVVILLLDLCFDILCNCLQNN